MSKSGKWYEPFTDQDGQRPQPVTPSRVLLAEDDPDMRELLKRTLTADGYTVTEAVDGMDVMEKLQATLAFPLTLPDVIVLDLVMPRYTGFGVLAALRRANWFTPVIVISAIGEESILQKAKELGATAFLQKPFSVEDFRVAVINASLCNTRAKNANPST